MPTRLSVQRTAGRFSISYDRGALRNVKITVGKKMTIGTKDELRVYLKGDARPSRFRTVLEGSIKLNSTETLTIAQDGIPPAGKRCIVEHDILLFETDVPAQHLWSPESSRKYRILSEKKQQTVR